jgi:hypothetical protein
LSFPIWAIKVYEARVRAKDGQKTWRLVEMVAGPSGNVPSDRFMSQAQAWASARGLDFRAGVRHGDVAGS